MKTSMNSFGIVIFLFVINGIVGRSWNYFCNNPKANNATLSPEEKLHQDVLCDYDSSRRPVKDQNKITYVKVKFRPVFYDIMQQQEIILVSGFVDLSWTDELLKWLPSKYGSTTELTTSFYDIWYPKITSYDSATTYRFIDEMDRFRFEDAKIKSNGSIFLRATVSLFGPCKYNSEEWPFEEWTCTFTLTKTNDENNMVQTTPFNPSINIDLGAMEKNNEWQIVSHPPFSLTNYLSQTLQLSVTLQRHVSHYQTVFVVPGVALLLLSLFSFWLTNRIYCRMLINMLTTLVQLSFIERIFQMLENNGSKGVVLYKFYSDTMFVSFIGLLLAVVNAKLLSRPNDPPNYITEIIGISAVIPYVGPVFSYFINDDIDDPAKIEEDEVGLVAGIDEKSRRKWRIVINFFDKCTFLLIVLYFVAFYFWRLL